jgi:hypothetical protein
MTTASLRKLPVLPCFVHAVKSAWHNLRFAFTLSLPWLLVLVPLNVWAELRVPRFDPATVTPEQLAAMQGPLLQFYAATFVSMIIYASIAVMWHLYILRDEVPAGAARLRLDGVVWRYVGNTILIGLMIMLLLLPLALVMAGFAAVSGGISPALLAVYMAAFLIIAVPVFYRLSIKLPAIALGRRDFRFGTAWNVTRGNMTQLMLLGVLSLAAVALVGTVTGVVEDLLTRLGGEVVTGVFLVLRQLLGWALGLFGITMLTSLYGFFVEGRDF